MAAAKKAPNPIDKHVGSRVRMRRMMLAMSQEKLGDALGLTFQQVQKYEKGTNRIGSSRMTQIANILKVPPTFFFEGMEEDGADGFLSTYDGLRLAKAFQRLKKRPGVQRAVVTLVKQLAGEQEDASE